MSFAVFADGSANLPLAMLNGIQLVPCEYTVEGVPHIYYGDVDHFDGKAFYEGLRQGRNVKTSLINTHQFLESFKPVIGQGQDLIYVSMSSGISGTYGAASVAAMELMDEFPDRFVHIVDSKGCGFGNALLALEAAALSREGVDVREAAKILDSDVPHACQYFTVDDLNFLKRTGRVSGATALIGTTLNIKPILYGDHTGHIVSCAKCRGRKKSIQMLADKYHEKHMNLANPTVFISHGDCLADAERLKELILAETPDANVVVCPHEPFSGAHVGPGMLGLFFLGKER